MLLALTGGVMTAVVFIDYRWTLWLGNHPWPAMADIMGRTLFEGQRPGGPDPVILYLLAAVMLYYRSWKGAAGSRVVSWRPQTGYIVASSLITAVLIVHSLKWIMGRARPQLVIQHQMAFTQWFAFGPHFITEGIYRGSFPSGHTAQAFLFMTLAYVLSAPAAAPVRIRRLGIAIGAATVVYALAMGIARCMSLSHWISDVVGMLLLGWVVMHLLYFKVMRVDDQQRYFRQYGVHAAMGRVWELVFTGYVLCMVSGIMMTVIGLRALWLGKMPALLAMAVPGLWLFGFGIRRCRRTHRQLVHCLRTPPVTPETAVKEEGP